MHREVYAQLQKSQQKYKDQYDKHQVRCNFQGGELILLKLVKERINGEGKKPKAARV